MAKILSIFLEISKMDSDCQLCCKMRSDDGKPLQIWRCRGLNLLILLHKLHLSPMEQRVGHHRIEIIQKMLVTHLEGKSD